MDDELLHIEGWRVNHKKIERLWREEGLQLPQRHKKRKRLYHKDTGIPKAVKGTAHGSKVPTVYCGLQTA